MTSPVDNQLMTEIRHELGEFSADPVQAAKQLVAMAEARALALHAATIVQTLPQDWVRYPNPRTGETYCYLQDKGAQRTLSLWGVTFDKISQADFVESQLDGGHVKYEVMVTGTCQRTGVSVTKLGTRSTAGQLWKDRWEDEETSTAQREQIKADVKKSAMTNGYGQVTRALTGMNGVPLDRLLQFLKCDPAKIPGIDFKTGSQTSGAKGPGPSERQITKLAMTALEKVEGLSPKSNVNQLKDRLNSCDMTSRQCSDAIDWLVKTEGRVPMQEFLDKIGFKPQADPPAAGTGATQAGPAPDPGKAPPAQAEGPKGKGGKKDDGVPKCPGCQRTMEVINDDGHTPECSQPSWSAPKS